MISKKNLALVYAVDQMFDYFELNGKPLPPNVSVTQATYEALREFVGQDRGGEIMQLTHYRKVPIKIIKINSKT